MKRLNRINESDNTDIEEEIEEELYSIGDTLNGLALDAETEGKKQLAAKLSRLEEKVMELYYSL